jgi:hypothetical protein
MAKSISKRTARPIPESMADAMPVVPRTEAQPTHAQIAFRAYERWQQTGCPSGSTELDWVEAERALAAPSL